MANVTRWSKPPHYGALVQSPFPGFVPVAAQRAWTAEIGTRGQRGDFVWDLTFYRAGVRGDLLSCWRRPEHPPLSSTPKIRSIKASKPALDWELGHELLGGPLRLRQTYAWSDFRFDGRPRLR